MSLRILVEEAKAGARICPFSFGVQEIRTSEGVGLREGGPWNCRGDGCMAWRWARTHIKDADGGGLVQSDDTHGFCGLAGNPDAVKP